MRVCVLHLSELLLRERVWRRSDRRLCRSHSSSAGARCERRRLRYLCRLGSQWHAKAILVDRYSLEVAVRRRLRHHRGPVRHRDVGLTHRRPSDEPAVRVEAWQRRGRVPHRTIFLPARCWHDRWSMGGKIVPRGCWSGRGARRRMFLVYVEARAARFVGSVHFCRWMLLHKIRCNLFCSLRWSRIRT